MVRKKLQMKRASFLLHKGLDPVSSRKFGVVKRGLEVFQRIVYLEIGVNCGSLFTFELIHSCTEKQESGG